MVTERLQPKLEQKKINILKVALAISIALTIVKFIAYLLTSSNAILTDAAESLVNIIAGGFALYSVILSAKPRDREHPYGHGKIEFLSAGAEGFMITAAGIFIIGKSIYGLFSPTELSRLDTGIILTAFAGIVNFIVGQLLIIKGKKWKSLPLIADGKHLRSDAITSAGLIIGLIVILITDIFWIDNIVAILFGFILIYAGYGILRKSVGGVMDEADIELINEVIIILNKNRIRDWIDFHNLRIIKYGANLHIDAHITLAYYWDLQRVHEELDKIEELINYKMGTKVELFIHPDPCVPQSCRICSKDDCPVRQHPFTTEVIWNLENVMQNEKHKLD